MSSYKHNLGSTGLLDLGDEPFHEYELTLIITYV